VAFTDTLEEAVACEGAADGYAGTF